MKKLEFTGEYDVIQRNFDAIEAAVPNIEGLLTGLGIRAGKATIIWPGGSPRASNTTVTHNLGRVPDGAGCIAATGVGGSTTIMPVAIMRESGLTATDCEISAVTSDGSSPAAATEARVWWVVVG